MHRALSVLAAVMLIAAIPAVSATDRSAAAAGLLPGYTYTQNLHPLGFSEKTGTFSSDLAFWGNLAVQGHFEGFRIIDISAPGKPKQLVDFTDCVGGTFTGAQGDVVVWGNILVRTWDAPAPAGGASCGGIFTPAGQEGLHIFDIRNPRNPVGLAFVPVSGGSHTATAVPDPANNRLLVYSSAASMARPGFDIVAIPLDAPAEAMVIGFEPAGRMCHDMAVILGDAMLAACAGHDGLTVWSLNPAKGGSLGNPLFLYQRSVDGVAIGHSATFSWDGRTIVFGHEPGGGVQPECQESSPEVNRTLFFFDAETGVEVGHWVMPRTQSVAENCSLHNFNVVPTQVGNVLVMGNYQSGISVVDFTDPANAFEIASADPAPLAPTQLGGDWAAYWYNGFIYESDITRGLRVWRLSDNAVAAAAKLDHLNPQTQEMTFELRNPPAPRGLTGKFSLVGHNPLLGRGMNAALAIHGNYAYIGSRTDGDAQSSASGTCIVICAKNAGLMIVDISDPTNPTLVHEMGPPLEGLDRESTRELRVWNAQEILMVLHTNCGGTNQHNCEQSSINNFRFYDISGEYATNPRLILQYNQSTHEFYLWEDPNNPNRALMFGGSAGTTSQIWDISPLRLGLPPVSLRAANHGYTRVPSSGPLQIAAGGLHSLSVSNDGTRAYYALLDGGFAIADVSEYTAGVPSPTYRLVTLNASRPSWAGPGAHSAVKFWNRDWVYVSDEVYGTATGSGHGCPWGWARMIDISDPLRPTVASQYRMPQNYTFLCPEFEPRPRTSYSAHNPTLTPNIAFTGWHSGGVQAVSLENPRYPYRLAEYYPVPVDIHMEDPRLSSDPDTGLNEKTVMWSYPIIKDGLIYVVDLRNGLYVLKYEGRFEGEVAEVTFLEGNSNIGHALCYEPVGAKPAYCP